MRHVLGDDHGDFDHAAYVAVTVAPGSLVNHLFNALLVNGVAVDGIGGDHVANFLLGLRAVAGHHVLAQHGASVLVKGGPRPLVHENHFPLQVTHGDGTMGSLGPSEGFVDDILLVHRYFSLSVNDIDGFAVEIGGNVAGNDVHQAHAGLEAGPADVWREVAVASREQGMVGCGRLDAGAVHGGGIEVPAVQRVSQGLLIDERATSHIEHD